MSLESETVVPLISEVQVPKIEVSSDFWGAPGMVIRQKSQKGEMLAAVLDVPYEQANRYKVSAMPERKQTMKAQDDEDGWRPSAQELTDLDPLMEIVEESSCCLRSCLMMLGCLYLRPLKLHFYEQKGDDAQPNEPFMIDRPFALGGCLGGCFPRCLLRMDVIKPEVAPWVNTDSVSDAGMFGMVRESYNPFWTRCVQAWCSCTTYMDIYEGTSESDLELLYQTRYNLACCGAHNNCCGGTCFNNDVIVDVLDKDGDVVSTLQKTYAAGSGIGWLDSALCRCCYQYSNWLVMFPEGADANRRALLLASVLGTDFQHHERKGNEGGGS